MLSQSSYFDSFKNPSSGPSFVYNCSKISIRPLHGTRYKIICNNSLISDAFSGSVYIISDNRIMSETEVLSGKPEGKRTV